MTKADLIEKMAKDGLTKAQAENAIESFVEIVSAALSEGDKITLVGFGTFNIGIRAGREGRNPRTGERISIPATKVVKFKAGKSLSDKIN